VPPRQLFRVLEAEDRLDDRDDEELEDQALPEQSEKLGKLSWQVQVGQGQVKTFENVIQHLEVVFDGSVAHFLNLPPKKHKKRHFSRL
jgi:hypothetical protein